MEDLFSDSDILKQYALIGEFVVRFEDINDWLRFLIPRVVFQEKQTETQYKNMDSLIENITAYPLRSKFDSLVADNFSDCNKLIILNNKLSSKQNNLPEIRNIIVHGSYRMGWKDFDGNLSKETLSIRHSKVTKRGFEKRSRIISTDKLQNLNNNLVKVSKSYGLIAAISRCLRHYEMPKQADFYLDSLEEQINLISEFRLDEIDISN